MFLNNKVIHVIVFGLKNNDDELNCLPCIYWSPKMHKILSGARFIVAGKKCINRQKASMLHQHSNYVTAK